MSWRNINIVKNDISPTGGTVQFPQWSVDITVEGIKPDNTPGTVVRTIIFPNVLNNAALSNAWLKNKLYNLCIEAQRVIDGIDEDQFA